MSWYGPQRLIPGEPVAKGRSGFLFVFDNLGLEPTSSEIEIAHGCTETRILCHVLGENIPGSGKGVLHIRNSLVRLYKRPGEDLGVTALLCQKRLGQGLQSSFAGHGGPGASFRPVREVHVFEPSTVLGFVQAVSQFGCEKTAFFQRGHDGLAAFVQFGEFLQTVADGGNGHLVERPCRLLTVAGDKGDCSPIPHQLSHRCHLGHGQGHFLGDTRRVVFIHANISSGLWRAICTGKVGQPRLAMKDARSREASQDIVPVAGPEAFSRALSQAGPDIWDASRWPFLTSPVAACNVPSHAQGTGVVAATSRWAVPLRWSTRHVARVR
ncbi:hypothetical protein DSECCO2_612830 [anaerobic digester metagenome]